MNEPQRNQDSVKPPLYRVLAEYFERVDRDEDVDTEAFAATHPDLADELCRYFDAAGRVDQMAGPLEKTTGPAPPASVLETGPVVSPAAGQTFRPHCPRLISIATAIVRSTS